MFISGCSYCLHSELQSFKSFFAIGCLAEQDPMILLALVWWEKFRFYRLSVLVPLCVANCFQCTSGCPPPPPRGIWWFRMFCVCFTFCSSILSADAHVDPEPGKEIFNPTSMDPVYLIMMLSWCICDSWAMAFVFWTRDSIQPGKAKNFLSRPWICIPMFRVYRIYWLNSLSTDAYGDPELGKEISFAVHSRMMLSLCICHLWATTLVFFVYSLWLDPAGQS
jgi:hypothetical protein